MKEALKYLEQYADEVEDEGLNTLADDIRECSAALKDKGSRLDQVDRLPSVVSESPKIIRYDDEQWEALSSVKRREGALKQRIHALEDKIDRLERQRTRSPASVSVSYNYDPSSCNREYDVRVRVTDDVLSYVQSREDFLVVICQEVAEKLRNALNWHDPKYAEPPHLRYK
jgi:hypothetical protein